MNILDTLYFGIFFLADGRVGGNQAQNLTIPKYKLSINHSLSYADFNLVLTINPTSVNYLDTWIIPSYTPHFNATTTTPGGVPCYIQSLQEFC
jgi:hypothetical protein